MNGSLLNPSLEKGEIIHLLLDSRKLSFPKTTLFFAIKGSRQNGHQFISDLYLAGVRNFVISQDIQPHTFPNANFILVSDTRYALQQLAAHHRQQFEIPILGITGSNGKTIVKEWLFQLLQPNFVIARSPRSYNSQIGVPLSVWQLNDHHELGIFEAGISQKGEMTRLANILQCDFGLITNLGAAHDEGFASRTEKLEEKLQLFQYTKLLFYRKDDRPIHEAVRRLGVPTCSWSDEDKADLEVSIHKTAFGTQIEGLYQKQTIQTWIPFQDDASIENAIHCWLIGLHLGLNPLDLAQRMSKLEPVGMRLESVIGRNNCTILNDSYNSDLTGLEIALNTLTQQSTKSKQTIILSDILQTGQTNDQLYEQVARLLEAQKIQQLIGIGTTISSLKSNLPSQIEAHFFESTEQFLKQLNSLRFQNEAILVKGARSFGFEQIVAKLALQNHRTKLEINLNAIVHNLQFYHSHLHPDTKLMVMVKAAAYGNGSVEIGRLLEFHRVDYLAVAYVDEGIELRQNQIRLPIMVLNPEPSSFDQLIQYHLEPEIYSLTLLQEFAWYTQARKLEHPIHLKIDTGMHRLGFEEDQTPRLIHILHANPQLKVASILSHLAASENEAEDAFTLKQIHLFDYLSQQILAALDYIPIRHILNTNGIIRFPKFQFDMVRLGIGLYGIAEDEGTQSQLETVATLNAQVSQIRALDIGETVGYGRHGKVGTPKRIAIITVGYADGLLRLAGRGNYKVNIRGYLVPIIGQVCMDMCMVDITDAPEVETGDEVVIFGHQPTVQDLADALQTIPYEVLTNISNRVKRVYIQE